MIGETLIVRRGRTDAMSNRSDTTHGAQGIFAFGGFTADRDHREGAHTTARLFVPRDADVKARDRITRSNGEMFAVVGQAQFDQDHPMTGHNFGWKLFQVESING